MEVVFILVEPISSGNIGASARAIKTMGFNQLRLVNPPEYLNDEARKFAYSSQEILENTLVFGSLKDAISDIDFIVGTSAKRRRVKYDNYSANEIPDIITSKKGLVKKLAIVFGNEESGLNNDELRLCNIISFVPMNKSYPSLNLSQSVMIYAYELFNHSINKKIPLEKPGEGSFRKIMEKTENVLNKYSINSNITLFNRIIERINILSKDDLNLLHSVYKYILKDEER